VEWNKKELGRAVVLPKINTVVSGYHSKDILAPYYLNCKIQKFTSLNPRLMTARSLVNGQVFVRLTRKAKPGKLLDAVVW
jgi:hypothetical protein